MADCKSKGQGQVFQKDVSQLIPLLQEVYPQWDQFGLYLPVSFDRIREIKRSPHYKEVKDKLIEVLDWYKRQRGSKEWKDITSALEGIRNFDLSSRIPQTGNVPVDKVDYISLMLNEHHLHEISADWKEFGMQIGIPFFELNAIDEGRRTPSGCMLELLSVWIQSEGKKATVYAIIKACESLQNFSLAEELEQNETIMNIMSRKCSDV